MRKLIISILIGVIFPLYASAGFVFRNDKDVTVVINDVTSLSFRKTKPAEA